jgi:hypothetical protein
MDYSFVKLLFIIGHQLCDGIPRRGFLGSGSVNAGQIDFSPACVGACHM